MRTLIAAIATLTTTAASAHPGHLLPQGGHDHLSGLGGVIAVVGAVAVAFAVRASLKGR